MPWLLIEVNSASPCPTLPPGRVPHEHRFPRSGGCVLGIIKCESNVAIQYIMYVYVPLQHTHTRALLQLPMYIWGIVFHSPPSPHSPLPSPPRPSSSVLPSSGWLTPRLLPSASPTSWQCPRSEAPSTSTTWWMPTSAATRHYPSR